MRIVDEFLSFLAQAYGKQPDQLKTLEKQAIAVMALAATSRLAPVMSQGLVVNALARRGALYVANHPLSTICAFWFAAYRNSQFREQWAGDYTREVETVIFQQLFARFPSVLRLAGRGARYLIRPELVAGSSRLAGLLRRIRIPRIPPSVINNAATRGAVNYVARHPAAAAAAYFSGQWIESTYRPQFFGRYSQEIITAGLLPLYAHGPRAIPSIIRGAGNTAYYGSRSLAWGLDKILGNSTTAAAGARTGAVATRTLVPLGVFGLGAVALYFQNRELGAAQEEERQAAWLAENPGTALAAASSLAALGYFSPSIVRTVRGSSLLNPATAAFKTAGISIISGLRWAANVRYFWAFPRAAQFVIRSSWVATGLLKVALPIELAFGLQGSLGYVTKPLAWIAGSGFIAPFFRTATLAGTGREYWSWVTATYAAVRHPIRFVRHEASVLSSLLRLPQVGRFLARSAPALRSVSVGLRSTVAFSARTLGTVARTVGSVPAGAALLLPDIVDATGRTLEVLEMQRELRERIIAQLHWLADLEDRGFVFARPVAQLAVDSFNIIGAVEDLTRFRAHRNVLDFLLSQESFAFAQLENPTFNALLQSVPLALSTMVEGVANFVSPPLSQRDLGRLQGSSPISAARDAWRGRTRDARGRFTGNIFPFNTGQPMPGFGFDEVMAYINRRAAAAALSNQQSATAGVPVQPAIHGGISGGPATGKGREFWLYRGRDRDLMLQTLRDMQAILERDTLAKSGKKTLTLSNRIPIFGDDVPGLEGSVLMLIRALKYDASLVRNRGPLGGYYSLEDME